MEDFNRIILIDKPAGISSFGVVAKVRWQLTEEKWRKMLIKNPQTSRKMARVKVGHCGTLDPFATGLLILVSGKFTRRAQEFMKLDKVYKAEIMLGAVSSTGDPEGKITQKNVEKIPEKSEIEQIIQQKFTGEIWQVPPIYSAIKINGQRAYKMARKSENNENENAQKELEAKISPRKITIFDLEILKYDFPILEIRAHVSSGTYIRTLAQDIGQALNCGAYAKNLRREKIGKFDIKDAKKLEDFA